MTGEYKKRKHIVAILVCLVLFLMIMAPLITFAQEAFVPLTGIPGVTSTTTDFDTFLNGIFNIGLAIAATLAVVMITIGGLQYMTTDSISNKSEGKDKIQNAVIGLLIALLIFIILFTINPNLLKFDITITPPPDKNEAGELLQGAF